MLIHLDIKIKGRVQGVFFRHSAREKARDLGICGRIKNAADGSVTAEAEGEEEDVKRFVAFCEDGPELASVEHVDVDIGEIKDYRDFRVDY